MKVICMDCQNESYSDLESLKANRSFTCAQCVEKSRSSSENEAGAGVLLELNQDDESSANPLPTFSPNSEIPLQGEDILELADECIISARPDQATTEQIIVLPEIETEDSLLPEEMPPGQIDNSLLSEAFPVSEDSSPQFSPEEGSSRQLCAAPEQGIDSSSGSPTFGILPVTEAEGIKRMRLMAFSTSKQLVIAGACVLSIILMQALFARSGQVEVKAENASQQLAPPAPVAEHRQAPAQAQVSQTGPAPVPAPTPAAAAAEKPVAAAPLSQPQPAAQPKGLYTVQVGAHQDEAEADDQAGKLRAAGFEPRVVSAEIPNRGVWYRVQVGDFSSRDEANRFGAMLRTKGLADNFIISAL